MIRVTRLSGEPYVINSELIESLEATPDTVIRLTSGKTVVVKESIDEIINKIIAYKQKIFSQLSILNNDSGNGV
ncbi:flagellar FlbD family protein [Geosporobacter ferrireducens]|uniref:Flagellar protein FlbD n=1 Tax=Geosporobacter ferrireducens TaxID=1424294 RepID=A0A1D8GBJ5_9FIRM|nr:flagellar FlbD family protein [Geosporobacter ferrireducens]AOT68275.1 flagellar protein FlbD [Geosporobacter ferrireducens]MTI57303.1 flagellar protein FlbD [Geosporobacter ferrireducens]